MASLDKPTMRFYYVYVLFSEKDKKLYIGFYPIFFCDLNSMKMERI
jgi:hypothetical protein